MNEHGEMVEWYWKGETEVFEKNLSQFHLVHHKPHIDWSGTETGPPRREAAK